MKPEKPMRYSQLIRAAAEGQDFIVEKDDISDPNPQLALGFCEPKYVDVQPRIQPAKTKAVRIGPVEGADVVLMIITPKAVMELTQIYKKIDAHFSGELGVEGEATALPYTTGLPNVSFLCNSARLLSGYRPSEVILSLPIKDAKELAQKIKQREHVRQTTINDVKKLSKQFEGKSPVQIIDWALEHFGDKIALANSFSAEDAMLTDIIWTINPPAKIFTLDTGRLNEETYDVWARIEQKYGGKIQSYHPDAGDVETLLRQKGPYSFRESVENRKECCEIRKVEPLMRALTGLDAWITGLRKSQSITRKEIETVEWDDANRLIKINPLAELSEDDVWTYIKEHDIPVNTLQKRGYKSIGCEPCTREITDGQDIRDGRWWWESPETKECGLHGSSRKN